MISSADLIGQYETEVDMAKGMVADIDEWLEAGYSDARLYKAARKDGEMLPASVARIASLKNVFEDMCKAFFESRARDSFEFSHGMYPDDMPFVGSITNTTSFGAVAKLTPEGPRVEVNLGTLEFLLWHAFKLVAMMERDEPRPLHKRRHMFPDSGVLWDNFDLALSPDTGAMALCIAWFAFQFIVFHEVGHLAQGHCYVIREGFHDFDHTEIAEREENRRDVADAQRQALEYHADIYAMRMLARYLRSRRARCLALRMISGGAEPKSYFLDALQRCYLEDEYMDMSLYASLTLIFHMTSEYSRHHPSRVVRFATAFTLARVLRGGWTSEFTSERHLDAIAVVRAATKAVTQSASDETLITDFLQVDRSHRDVVMADMQRYEELFAKLRLRLEPYVTAPHAFAGT